MNNFEEDEPTYKVGRMEGDLRRYYKNRPLAQRYADLGQRTWETVFSATVQYEPDHGFVAVLYSPHNLPQANELGYEVHLPHVPEKSPSDWHTPTKSARTAPTSGGGGVGTPTAPSKGATARVWAIADEVGAASRADRSKVIDACTAQGINPSTAATQWSKYAKSKGW